MTEGKVTGRQDLVGSDGWMVYIDHSAKGTIRPSGKEFKAQLVKSFPKVGAPVMAGQDFSFPTVELAEEFISKAKPPKEAKVKESVDPNQTALF